LRLTAAARRFARQTDKVRQRGSRRLGGGDAGGQYGRSEDQGAKRHFHFAIPPWIKWRPCSGRRTAALSLLDARNGAGGIYGTIDRTSLLGKNRTSGTGGTTWAGVKASRNAGSLPFCAS
jgi:hypothetical protein